MVSPIVPKTGELRAILINNDAEKTNSPIVDLILSAQHAAEMMLSNDPDFTGASFETFVTAKQWTLADEQVGPGFGDGEKTVYVKFRSITLNESDVHSATITLDTSPPIVGALPILINEGAVTTNNRQVTLILDASDAATVEIFNEDELETFTEGTVLPYAATISWQLSEGNGTKRVLVAFRDDIGNSSAFFSDRITLVGQAAGDPVVTEPADGVVTTDHFITVRGTGNPGSLVQIDIDGDV